PAKALYGLNPYRGFESLSLRQLFLQTNRAYARVARSKAPHDRDLVALARFFLEAQTCGEVEHVVVRPQDHAVKRTVAGRSGSAGKALEQRAAEPFALPGVRHDERELGRLAVRIGRVASDRNERFVMQRDERELAVVIELSEAGEQLGRQMPQVLHEALVARALGKCDEEALLELGVLRPHRPQAHLRAAGERELLLELDRVGMDRHVAVARTRL